MSEHLGRNDVADQGTVRTLKVEEKRRWLENLNQVKKAHQMSSLLVKGSRTKLVASTKEFTEPN